jgi:hypothetical protein
MKKFSAVALAVKHRLDKRKKTRQDNLKDTLMSLTGSSTPEI